VTLAVSCAPHYERLCAVRHPHPRRGQPWALAEDARLLALVKEGLEKFPGKSIYCYKAESLAQYVAEALGRTASAIMTRYQTLEVCRKRKCGG
jgi:hypothetical protein